MITNLSSHIPMLTTIAIKNSQNSLSLKRLNHSNWIDAPLHKQQQPVHEPVRPVPNAVLDHEPFVLRRPVPSKEGLHYVAVNDDKPVAIITLPI